MANLNRVFLIGNLTRDPELRTIPSGTRVAKFGLAVNNPRRNPTTGEWDSNPVFVDIEVWNTGQFNQADRVEQFLRKGKQVFIEGRLRLDQWTGQDGQKRSRLYVVADRFQLLEARGGEGMEGGMSPEEGMPRQAAPSSFRKPASSNNPPAPNYSAPPSYEESGESDGGGSLPDHPHDGDIPF